MIKYHAHTPRGTQVYIEATTYHSIMHINQLLLIYIYISLLLIVEFGAS